MTVLFITKNNIFRGVPEIGAPIFHGQVKKDEAGPQHNTYRLGLQQIKSFGQSAI
jgi:hypothetical protein